VRDGLPAARPEFEALAAGSPAARWTWRAAAVLQGCGVLTGGEALLWPAEDTRGGFAPRPAAPLGAKDAERARDDAIAYLVRTQRPDGTWAVPMSFAGGPPSSMNLAVTAIAGSALLRHRGSPGVNSVLFLAEEALLHSLPRLEREHDAVFDYTVWAQIFALRFLADASRGAGPARAEKLRAAASDLAHALRRGRQSNGGWSYVDLSRAGASADNSISFVTAAAVLALIEAREAGVKDGSDMVSPAADLVESLRHDGAVFGYQTATAGVAAPTEAALRGPLCAYALRRAGRAKDTADLEAAFRALAGVQQAFLKETGKPLCHTAPDATSGYYVLYGLRFAAEASAELPEPARAAARRDVLETVLKLRRDDGSFCDFPSIGPAYGTAMALDALDRLIEKR
jgi:hypothetical protein